MRADLVALRGELVAEAAAALEHARLKPGDRYWSGRSDALALALALLDNVIDQT